MRWIALAVIGAVAACGGPHRNDARVLAMGDSVLTWNQETSASIPDVVSRALGEPVFNAAVSGARMDGAGLFGPFGFSIPRQYRRGPWKAAILNGGANDLLSDCGCSGCEETLNDLVGPDGNGGAYNDLLSVIEADTVVLVGYYGPSRDPGGAFGGCTNDLLELGRRLSVLADQTDGVIFVTARDVIDGSPALYDPDRVHPSPAGSSRIGLLVAQALR